jgi:hypothetical protein
MGVWEYVRTEGAFNLMEVRISNQLPHAHTPTLPYSFGIPCLACTDSDQKGATVFA